MKGDSDLLVKDTIVFQVAALSSWFLRKGRSMNQRSRIGFLNFLTGRFYNVAL